MPGDVVLRPAGLPDAGALRMLAMQVFVETYAPDGIDAAMAREVESHFSAAQVNALFTDPGIAVLVAERAGRLLGFAQLQAGAPCPVAAPQPATTELQRLYVLQSATGQGIGKALLRAAQDWAAGRGGGALWLKAWVGNARALAFYRSQGYADRGAAEYRFEDQVFENRVFVSGRAPPPPGPGAPGAA